MKATTAVPTRPGMFILLLWLVVLGASVPYAVFDSAPSGLRDLCLRLWLGLAVVAWVSRDLRGRSYRPAFEYTAFMLVAWPVLLPYHLVRTRGRAGFFLSGWLYGPFIVLAAVYLIVKSLI